MATPDMSVSQPESRSTSFVGHTHRVPPALAPRGGGAAAGDLGRLADPSAGGGPGVRVEHAGSGVAGGPAGIRPRPQPLGRGRVAFPEGCRDAQPGVPGPGGGAPGTRPRRRAPATEASSGPLLLCTGRVEAPGNLNLIAQRSVKTEEPAFL